MMAKQPGGEFAGAWSALAAASRGQRNYNGPYSRFTTQYLKKWVAAGAPNAGDIMAEIERREQSKTKRALNTD